MTCFEIGGLMCLGTACLAFLLGCLPTVTMTTRVRTKKRPALRAQNGATGRDRNKDEDNA